MSEAALIITMAGLHHLKKTMSEAALIITMAGLHHLHTKARRMVMALNDKAITPILNLNNNLNNVVHNLLLLLLILKGKSLRS
jgi:hypothetical protein